MKIAPVHTGKIRIYAQQEVISLLNYSFIILGFLDYFGVDLFSSLIYELLN